MCTTCYGYGLWGIGDNSPMGEMDAIDGLPTIPCPECKADYNGKKLKHDAIYITKIE